MYLVQYSDQDGFVPEIIAMTALKYHTGSSDLSRELFTRLVDESVKYIERKGENIRATYGHTGHMLFRINWGRYVPYQGPYQVFCISHITRNGLGAVNFNRRFNILNVSERCENKGVKAFINIKDARSKGIEFWSQVGDRYGNKIFCFDPNLNECFYRYEYTPDYTSKERIMEYQSNYVDMIKRVCGLDESDAIRHIQNLMICEDDYIEDDDKLSDYEGAEELDMEKLKL
jgi:hypothetical protein